VRFKNNLQKRTLAFKGPWDSEKTINFCGKLSFTLSFFFAQRITAATYIFTAPACLPACRATIIPLEPCALNVEIQHLQIPLKEGVRG